MDEITVILKAVPENESFARVVIAAFAARVNPAMDVLSDVKTAVSEAVTNAVIHAYDGDGRQKDICIKASIQDKTLKVDVKDYGQGIHNVLEAMTDFYTSKPCEERSGLGFTIMGSFMDSLEVLSAAGEGTTIRMSKKLA
jgi:stage II sporulation protein AB (anti-sigma F factor)